MIIDLTLAIIAMAFTALSFGQMAGAFPKAGSTYTYTRHGLNQYLGLLGGWTILLDYVLLDDPEPWACPVQQRVHALPKRRYGTLVARACRTEGPSMEL